MLPTGLVTFLFTDIEGSTRLLQLLGDEYAGLLAQHHHLLRETCRAWDGIVIDAQGDAFFVVFRHAADAVAAAVAAQRALAAHPWPQGAAVRVRMGLHTGEPLLTEEGYYVGLDLHRAARVCAAGHGGQVLLTQATCNLALNDLPFGVSLLELGEHRLKDLLRPEHLYQLVIPGLTADFPPLRSLEAFIHNLPIQLTSFIGREKEMAEIRRLLGTTRLLTLTGPGGTGKTRLALQVAGDLQELFSDGLRFVELAPVTDPALVPQNVAAVLGLREEPGYPLVKTVVDYLRARSLLLILDNCEHLVAGAAELAETILRACPRVKILASSREALGIAGESTFTVPSLSLPPIGSRHRPPVETLTQYEAVRLFIERAGAALPGFTVTNDNAPAVAQICHRLDGIPLAIELAAARVKTLQVEQIAARLDDRFPVLANTSRAAVPRQQTLRTLIDWSYNLLSEPERVLFRRLSVFAGGWTLPAAEAICDFRPIQNSFDVLDLLTQLANKSLVVVERKQGAETHYHFMETIRQYAREKVLDAGEGDLARQRHWAYFLRLAEEAEPRLRDQGQQEWLDRLEVEHDNLRAALHWSLSSGQGSSVWLPQEPWSAEGGLRLASALWWFWFLRGYLSEGRRWFEGLLAEAGKGLPVPPARHGRALSQAGFLAFFQGDGERAAALAGEGLALARQQAGDQEGLALALFVMGNAHNGRGDRAQAAVLFQESLALFRALSNDWGVALVLNVVGWGAFLRRNYKQAEAMAKECLMLRRKLGVKVGIAAALDLLGSIARVQGHYQRAAALLEESLALTQGLKIRPVTSITLNQLGRVAHAQGDFTSAASLHEEALGLFRELEDRQGTANTLCLLGTVVWRQGDDERTRALLGEALALAREIDDQQIMAEINLVLGDVARTQGDDDRAVALYRTSLLRALDNSSSPELVIDGLQRLAAMAGRQGQVIEAACWLAAVQARRQALDTHLSPVDQDDYDREVAAVRGQLDGALFDQVWAEGVAIAAGDWRPLIEQALGR
ncbi:MAG: tetratricopeptide repeat protein [Chloroflexi bacterium]|nr:tetratricopeptide repeat protein [Chloroflexota bacterium]MCI0577848.1 tetratricopeptide repeat protein [Chloroflexota bacterium]MCI0643830.1 tetratricopeptide repeat protein [Chloroflexota bacterium]MCI0726072.1 tetratricopeptide repeat protein [Chloroflexota bacterium]